jgi:anti-sigma B factor antagonist
MSRRMPEVPASTSLVLKLAATGDQVRIRVAGDLDFSSARRLERAIDQLGDMSGRTLLLDFTDAGYVDSSGLTVIVEAKLRGDTEGFRVRLEGTTTGLRRMLSATGLERLFAE